MCFQVGVNSKLFIKKDPWLYKLDNFRIPYDLRLPAQFQQLKDLMCNGGTMWNRGIIVNLFPPLFRGIILDTPIIELEQD